MGVTVTIEHGTAGTLVHGTSRGDLATNQALKQTGFRWSRHLNAWYLPRTWTEPTRAGRVAALTATLGADNVTVTRDATPAPSAAERDAQTRERAAERAERMDARAVSAQAKAHSAEADRRRIQDSIPLGQPVLVGHHSEPRHRRDLARIDRNMQTEVEETRRAESAVQAADRARSVASGTESKVTTANRIERNEAELRRVRRALNGTGRPYTEHEKPATGAYRDRKLAEEADLVDRINYDRAKLAAAGGITYGRDTVAKGDLVKIRRQWYPVVRSNAKSVTVPGTMAAADSKWTDTASWQEVQDHIARSDATPERVRQCAAETSPAFPGLRERLTQYAADLPDREVS